jgi:hypothetical protein
MRRIVHSFGAARIEEPAEESAGYRVVVSGAFLRRWGAAGPTVPWFIKIILQLRLWLCY